MSNGVVSVNAYFLLGGFDMSAYVRTVKVNWGADVHEDTTMGDGSKTRAIGLKDGSVEVEWNQNYADAGVSETIWGLIGTSAAFTFNPDGSSTSATNPKITGNVIVNQTAVGGGVNTLDTSSMTMPGNGLFTRAEA